MRSTTSSATRVADRRVCRTTATSPKRQLRRARPDLAAGRLRRRARSTTTRRSTTRATWRSSRAPRAVYGAHVASRVRVDGFLQGRAARRRRQGARPRDRRAVRDPRPPGRATPPACGPTRPRRWSASAASSRCGRPRGSTSSCPGTASSRKLGLLLRTEKSVLFVIPWGRHWLIGTTDTDWDLDKAHPAATAADIDYLLEHVNTVLRDAARPATTSRACTRGCGRCSPASPTRPASSAASTS